VEYDTVFVCANRSKITFKLPKATLTLIRHFSDFYAVEPDQLVDTAIGNFLLQDQDFLKYLDEIHQKAE